MKKTIAIDIDDVLSMHAEAFVNYSNMFYGTKFGVDDYSEHWSELWNVDYEELEHRVGLYHARKIMAQYYPKENAQKVLEQLREHYSLLVITSRKSSTRDMTEKWLDRYFSGIFEKIYFAGMWDVVSDRSINETKAKLCLELKADYLIDDQLKHCIAVDELGIQGIVFGDYAWNKSPSSSFNLIRCKDWNEVAKYFDEQSRK